MLPKHVQSGVTPYKSWSWQKFDLPTPHKKRNLGTTFVQPKSQQTFQLEGKVCLNEITISTPLRRIKAAGRSDALDPSMADGKKLIDFSFPPWESHCASAVDGSFPTAYVECLQDDFLCPAEGPQYMQNKRTFTYTCSTSSTLKYSFCRQIKVYLYLFDSCVQKS